MRKWLTISLAFTLLAALWMSIFTGIRQRLFQKASAATEILSVPRCPDELNAIVMKKLDFHPKYINLDVSLSHDYSEQTWRPRFEAEQKELDRIRAWSETLSDRCIRDAYRSLLDYYQRELDGAQDELQKHSEEIYKQEQEIRSVLEDIYETEHKIPAPPRK